MNPEPGSHQGLMHGGRNMRSKVRSIWRSSVGVWLRRAGIALLLSLIVLMEMLDNMPIAAAASHAATKLPIAQANYTLQQFLKQGHPYQPKDAPLARSEKTPALPRGIAPPKQTSQPLPSSEPAKVKAVSQTLPAASLTPTSSATTSTTSTASPTPLRLTGSDANYPKYLRYRSQRCHLDGEQLCRWTPDPEHRHNLLPKP